MRVSHKVRWSENGWVHLSFQGTIIAVVPHWVKGEKLIPKELHRHASDFGGVRRRKSYLVRVMPEDIVHWPEANLLIRDD